MSQNATYRERVNPRSHLISIAILAMAGVLLAGFGGSAVAAPLAGKDGKIYACYKVKGKPKGAMRLLFKPKKKCKRGERKVAWVAASGGGVAGQQGGSGAADSQGEVDPALAAQISALSLRLDSLEGVLAGVTNAELTEAIGLIPVVDSLCTQTSELTSTLDLLNTAVGGLALNGVLTGLGGLLNIPTLPATLGAFSCPTVP